MHRNLCTASRVRESVGAAVLAAALIAAPAAAGLEGSGPQATGPQATGPEGAGPSAARPHLAGAAPILPLEEVEPGQRGYGLSVFRGDAPEPFEVEVLGIWRNVAPDTSYILARLSGQGLEQSGVVSGMSGSPVFLDERLAGAVAFAWPFSQEAIAGITPIEMMRALIDSGDESATGGPAAAPPTGWVPELDDLARGRLPAELLEERLRDLLPAPAGAGRSPLQWSAAGFGEATRGLLERSLGGMAAAGSSPGGACDLVPGGPVGGILVDGDLRLAVTGTVTDRVGDQVLAFGHPFLGVGAMRMPMACADVVTVLSSRLSSFRISNVGRVVGGFDLDRAPGIRGRLGLRVPMIPLRVTVTGAGRRGFDLKVADIPLISPTLVAISVLGALDSSSRSAGDQGLDLAARFRLEAGGELEIRQSFDGQQAAFEAALHLLGVASYVLNNRMAEVRIEELEVDLTQHERPRTASLVEAHAASTVVRPGDEVALNFDLVAYRGDRFRRSLVLQLPAGLPDGRYSVLAGDGASVDAARLAIEAAAPVNFNQALELLRGLHSRRQLVVLGVFAGQGLAVAGEVLPQLPGSLRSIWGAAASGSARPLRLAIAQQEAMDLEVPIEGIVRIDLEVRRREPLSPAEAGGDAESAGEEPGVETPAAAGGGPDPAAESQEGSG